MATLRELKGRLGSVASSEKITGAMKMISSAKMHKAEGALKRLVPFRDQIETIISNLVSADTDFTSPLTVARPVKTVAVAVFGSDDGLCGGYNVNIAKYLKEQLDSLRAEVGQDVKVVLYPVGAKIAKAVQRYCGAGVSVATDINVDSKSGGDAVKAFIERLRDSFISGEADRVEAVYMRYYSAGRQRPQTHRLMPVDAEAFGGDKATGRPYLFEPSAEAIFRTALPMYLLATMQDIFYENRASEQAARVMAMQAANDNAKKLQESLQLEFNKLRQQSITTELLDIVGGQVRD